VATGEIDVLIDQCDMIGKATLGKGVAIRSADCSGPDDDHFAGVIWHQGTPVLFFILIIKKSVCGDYQFLVRLGTRRDESRG
jgi:hypothetical protein